MLAALPAGDNPYLWQMLAGRFPDSVVYPWLTLPPPERMPEVIWSRSGMTEALRERPGAFDFVHLSNILVTVRADAILKRLDILNNPYLIALRDGAMTLDRFGRTQEQFFFAVTFFSRPMAALVARIPGPKTRLDILHNLVEEHGEFDEKAFHHHKF